MLTIEVQFHRQEVGECRSHLGVTGTFIAMIIDAHTHCFPDQLAEKVIPMLAARANIPYFSDGTLGGLIASMDRAGVDLSLVQHIATKPQQVQTINNWAASIQSERIKSFGTVHPDYPHWEQEIERIAELGLVESSSTQIIKTLTWMRSVYGLSMKRRWKPG